MKRQRIIVQGILLDKDRVLIAKRSLTKKIAPGKYHIPGGHVEYGEDPDDTIVREFKEEFGIQIKPQRIIRAFSYIANQAHEVGIVYLVSLLDHNSIKDIKINKNDNEKILWLSKNELSDYMPSDDNDYITLNSFY